MRLQLIDTGNNGLCHIQVVASGKYFSWYGWSDHVYQDDPYDIAQLWRLDAQRCGVGATGAGVKYRLYNYGQNRLVEQVLGACPNRNSRSSATVFEDVQSARK